MALVYCNGFDVGDASARMVASASPTSSTTTLFSAGRSVYPAGTIDKVITAVSQVWVGAACNMDYKDASDRQWFSFFGDGGTTQHVTVAFYNGTIVVRRGGPGGTLLTTYAGPIALSTWYYVEVSVTISDTVGTVTVKVNGTTVITLTAADTKNAGTATTIDKVQLGSTTGANFLFDDFYIDNAAFLGDVKVTTLSPTAAGSSTQWTPDTGSNYARVNEIPWSAANYVQSGTSGNRDTYALADLTGSPTVLAVNGVIIAKKTDAGTMSVKTAVKSSATVAYGSSTALGTTDAAIENLMLTDPATAAAWTASGVNALEAGMEVV